MNIPVWLVVMWGPLNMILGVIAYKLGRESVR